MGNAYNSEFDLGKLATSLRNVKDKEELFKQLDVLEKDLLFLLEKTKNDLVSVLGEGSYSEIIFSSEKINNYFVSLGIVDFKTYLSALAYIKMLKDYQFDSNELKKLLNLKGTQLKEKIKPYVKKIIENS